jgi:hypothetical protein
MLLLLLLSQRILSSVAMNSSYHCLLCTRQVIIIHAQLVVIQLELIVVEVVKERLATLVTTADRWATGRGRSVRDRFFMLTTVQLRRRLAVCAIYYFDNIGQLLTGFGGRCSSSS